MVSGHIVTRAAFENARFERLRPPRWPRMRALLDYFSARFGGR